MDTHRNGIRSGFILKSFQPSSSFTFLLPLAEKLVRNESVSPRDEALFHETFDDIFLEDAQIDPPETRRTLDALKARLLLSHTVGALLETLESFLPSVGIVSFSLVLYDDDVLSRYAGGFGDGDALKKGGVPFSAKSLLPDDAAPFFPPADTAVFPLFSGNDSLGYFAAACGAGGRAVCAEIAPFVSNALFSALLFEKTVREKEIAQKAEFEKTEFFANVGSDLCDPLKDLSAKVSQIEKNVNEGLSDPDILGEQLLFLKSQIEAQLAKTETLVELTRSQINDLPMDKKLFDVRTVLPVSVAELCPRDVPLLLGDALRLKKAFSALFDAASGKIDVSFDFEGAHFSFDAPKIDWARPEFQLAEKIVLLQYGAVQKSPRVRVSLFWPNLADLPPIRNISGSVRVFSLSAAVPTESVFGKSAEPFSAALPDDEGAVFLWDADKAPIDEWVNIYSLRRDERIFRTPLLCFSRTLIGHDFTESLEQKVKSRKSSSVLFIGAKHTRYGTWATEANSVSIASMDEFERIVKEIAPSLIVFGKTDEEGIVRIRQHQKTVTTPIIVIPETIGDEGDVAVLCAHPKVILCNHAAAESEQFASRVADILAGGEILPPHTGALVKKAIFYLNKNAGAQVVRWKLADSVHVSEDYLTRIFHKEIGLSLWEYLNRYRVFLATKLLLETNESISEIAEDTGFQDQAYFCRVFKKMRGIPPGKIRTKK